MHQRPTQHGVVVISLAFVVDARHALGRLVTWLDQGPATLIHLGQAVRVHARANDVGNPVAVR